MDPTTPLHSPSRILHFSAERSERKGPIPVNIHFAARPVETPVLSGPLSSTRSRQRPKSLAHHARTPASVPREIVQVEDGEFWCTVFGFPTDMQQKVFDFFVTRHGATRFRSSPNGEHWMYICFPSSRLRDSSLVENGVKMDRFMIGVLLCSESEVPAESREMLSTSIGKRRRLVEDSAALDVRFRTSKRAKPDSSFFTKVKEYIFGL
eukprot:TRINITY_DN1768_c0_g1_i1.p1 TRINITY_DN1768_c0_g1~~TRINITY_DN1768_c0_g1_i1.p1  ORF type:complete len:208 (-),score=55.63 TRINITY_DN1768_c0_g1_i1:159-782(-)